jgi:hypothetical protein
MTYIPLKPTAIVEVDGIDPVAASEGTATLDAGRVPYAAATLTLPLEDLEIPDDLDPREGRRVTIDATEHVTGTSRSFDLGIRSRTVDHRARTITVEAASDEALLLDYAVLEEDLGAFEHQGSLRGIVNWTLEKIGAALEPGEPDVPFWTLTDAENLVLNPRNVAGGATVYAAGNASSLADTTFPGPLGGVEHRGEHIYNPTTADSYVDVARVTGMSLGMLAGRTYTFSATGSVRSTLTGTAHATRARRIVVFHRAGDTGPYTEVVSPQIPTTVEGGPLDPANEHRVSVTFTLPEDTAEAFIRVYHGYTGGTITWAMPRLSEHDDRPGADNVEYFSGSTVDSDLYGYVWEDEADASASRRIALIDRSPEVLVLEPGMSLWDFIEPLTASAGLRLFCDEQRVWRLVDPGEYAVPGRVTVTPQNTVEGTDTITRENAEVWCTGVLIRYRWRDRDGIEQERIDVAGEPGRVLTIELERAYPGPGLAQAILTRRVGRGRTQDVTVFTRYDATPGQEASISLPGTVDQIGRAASIEWGLTTGLMRLGSRGLTDAEPGTWLAWDREQNWANDEPFVDPELDWEDA